MHRFLLLLPRERWILWVPVLFATGVGLYAMLTQEPARAMWVGAAVVALLLLGASWFVPRLGLRMVAVACAIIVLGAVWMGWRAEQVKAPLLPADLMPVWVTGTIVWQEQVQSGWLMVLGDLDVWQRETKNFPPEYTPAHIRLTVRTDLPEEGLLPGDRIRVRAMLKPPERWPVYPGSYYGARDLYFKQIGATGYSISPVKLRRYTPPEEGFARQVERLRLQAATKIRAAMAEAAHMEASPQVGAALLTGMRRAIDDATWETIRRTGLGHLLAISGLHMGMVMGGVFFMLRAFAALFPWLVLRFPVKKAAAWGALFAGAGYLLLSGAPVSAMRAYCMGVLFFLTILLDRIATPMRPVAFAAMLIMLLTPEAALSVSFQLSFAAVIGLVAAYEAWRDMRQARATWSPPSWWRRVRRGVGGVFFSSVVALAATGPIGLYYFGLVAPSGLLANMVAIPLTGLWILPAGMVGMVLMPLGLEAWPLALMAWGVDALLAWASWIEQTAGEPWLFAQPSAWALLVWTLGGLWLCVWRGPVRLAGLVPLVVGSVWLLVPPPMPDVVVDGGGRMFAMRTEEGDFAFSSLLPAKYARSQWMKAHAQTEVVKLSEVKQDPWIACDDHRCVYHKAGRRVAVIKEKAPIWQEVCAPLQEDFYEVVVDLRAGMGSCEGVVQAGHYWRAERLKRRGTHRLWLQKEGVRFEDMAGIYGNRLWTEARAPLRIPLQD